MKNISTNPMSWLSALSIAVSFSAVAYQPVIVDEGVFVLDPSHSRLAEVRAHRELSVDHVSRIGYEVYGPRNFSRMLTQSGISFLNLVDLQSNEEESNARDYPSFPQVEARLRAIVSRCSNIMELVSIGKSTEGRDLWVVKVSSDPRTDQLKPEVKYISSMHGDEITGREVMQEFLDDICTNYGKDAAITQFVNSLEIFLMPSMNPDGSQRETRGNARGVDLNRDFPDIVSDRNESSEGRAMETQAIMKFQTERNFALSANFHGGSEVVNYPWDTTSTRHPEDALFRELSLTYAGLVPYMKNSDEFRDGITNGYDWYEIDGGMQDWSNLWHNDMQVTIEISGTKWPAYSQIAGFWRNNRSALYAYLQSALQGAGFKMNPQFKSGAVSIQRKSEEGVLTDAGSFRFQNAEFYKILPPGTYRFQVTPDAQNAQVETFESTVKKASDVINAPYQNLNR